MNYQDPERRMVNAYLCRETGMVEIVLGKEVMKLDILQAVTLRQSIGHFVTKDMERLASLARNKAYE